MRVTVGKHTIHDPSRTPLKNYKYIYILYIIGWGTLLAVGNFDQVQCQGIEIIYIYNWLTPSEMLRKKSMGVQRDVAEEINGGWPVEEGWIYLDGKLQVWDGLGA